MAEVNVRPSVTSVQVPKDQPRKISSFAIADAVSNEVVTKGMTVSKTLTTKGKGSFFTNGFAKREYF